MIRIEQRRDGKRYRVGSFTYVCDAQDATYRILEAFKDCSRSNGLSAEAFAKKKGGAG